MRRLFALLVCAQFILSGALMVFPHSLDANPNPDSLSQASALAIAFSLTEMEGHGKPDPHSADPQLADLLPELPELASGLTVSGFQGLLATAYGRMDQAGSLRPVMEGPRRPPRPFGVFL
ncbi:hypothetical protein [Polaromonas sp.]|uniref:hypothetical protein n=1 Tax=Polaromonas sp. TaxID=1869339 RepID=UPI003753B6C7